MPVGLLIFILLVGVFVLLQLIPVPRNPLVRVAAFWTSMVVNEQPHWVAFFLIASTALAVLEGDISGAGWATVGLAVILVAGLLAMLGRAFPGRFALRSAIGTLDPKAPVRLSAPRRHLTTTLLAPLAFGRVRVKRIGDLSYGPAGKRNLFDIYRPRNGEVTGPTLIYLHGGGFKSGAKRREGQRALYRLAASGWVCIGANYRMSPEVQFPEYAIDLKKVIAWAKSEGLAHGVDPERIFLAGGSAGGHIAATAGLTANEPLLQPGFEDADTSVAGVVGLYGYYGNLKFGSLRPGGPISSSPRELVRPGAPPFLVIHGQRDTVVGVGNARRFVGELESAGNEVAFAELSGAQHTFDLLRSVRVEDTIDAIEDFAEWAALADSGIRR